VGVVTGWECGGWECASLRARQSQQPSHSSVSTAAVWLTPAAASVVVSVLLRRWRSETMPDICEWQRMRGAMCDVQVVGGALAG